MNSIIIFCASLISGTATDDSNKLYENLGVFLSHSHKEMFFKENTIEVMVSRHYTSNCDAIREHNLMERPTCHNNYDTKNSEETMIEIIKECETIWSREMSILQELSPRIKEKRPNRSVTGILTGVSLFTNLYSSLTTTFSNLYHFYQNRQTLKKQEDLYLKGSSTNIVLANIAKQFKMDLLTINNIICQSNSLKYNALLKMHANHILQKSIETIENEIISLNFNSLPRNLNFLQMAMKACMSIKPNSIAFCHYVIFNSEVDIRFDGLVPNDIFLVALFVLKFPVMSNELIIKNIISVTNIGYFEKDQYNIIDIPKIGVQTNFDSIYELNSHFCKKMICHVNAVSQNIKSRCLTSIMQNTTQNCVSVISEAPFCHYKKVPSGHLIIGQNALFFPISENHLDAIPLKNSSLFTQEAGRLLCSHEKVNMTHIISQPLISVHFNSSLKINNPVLINHKIDLELIKFRLSDDLSLMKELENIYNEDDTLKIGDQKISTIIFVIVCSSILPIIILCVLIGLKYRDVLNNYRNIMKSFFRSKKGADKIKIENEADLDSKSNACILIDHVREEIRPNLADK